MHELSADAKQVLRYLGSQMDAANRVAASVRARLGLSKHEWLSALDELQRQCLVREHEDQYELTAAGRHWLEGTAGDLPAPTAKGAPGKRWARVAVLEFAVVVVLALAVLWLALRPAVAPPLPANVRQVLTFDSEAAIEDWELQILFEDGWRPASERLGWADTGFSDGRSLSVAVELLPSEMPYYSVQYCWDEPVALDGISVRLHAPDGGGAPVTAPPAAFEARLLVLPASYDDITRPWPWSHYRVDTPGWHALFMDFRLLSDYQGNPLAGQTVRCFHMDLALPPASGGQAQAAAVLIDDVTFYRQLPTPGTIAE